MRAGVLHDAFRRLPIRTLDETLPGTTLLIAPHADDESLGCGGLIAGLCAAGRPPVVVVLTDGAGSHPSSPSWPAKRLTRRRRFEAIRATARLGLSRDRLYFLDLPDARSPHDGPGFVLALARLSAILTHHACDAVVTTWRYDPHCDHESAWLMGEALAMRHSIALMAYPVWGWLIDPDTDLACAEPTGWRIDVAQFLDAKCEAIASHESQYGGLITDDPCGFVLPQALLAVFEGRYETVLLA